MMKLRISIVLALTLLSVLASSAQTDNTLHVKVFGGTDVGTKVVNAMASCNPSTVIPCILIIDPSLAGFPPGTMPALCAQCSLIDYRTGAPSPSGGCAGTGGNLQCATVALNSADHQFNFLANGLSTLPAGFADSVLVGNGAGAVYGTGSAGAGNAQTVALGWDALHAAGSCYGCTAIGANAALNYLGDGSGVEDGQFVAVGSGALGSATIAHEVVAIGHSALGRAANAADGVHIGDHGSYDVLPVANDTIIGANSGFLENTAPTTDTIGTQDTTILGGTVWSANNGTNGVSYSTAATTIIGAGAGGCFYNAPANTIIGAYAGGSHPSATSCPATLPTGGHNIFMTPGMVSTDGSFYTAGGQITTGSNNILIGLAGAGVGGHPDFTGSSLTTGGGNTVVGGGALALAATVSSSSVFGGFAAYSSTVSIDAFGFQAGILNTTGANNVFLGTAAGAVNTTGGANTAVGVDADFFDNSGDNTYIGQGATAANATGGFNTAVGQSAMLLMTSGSSNTAVGRQAGCTGACSNIEALGFGAIVLGVNGAAQIGVGTNSTANTLQYLNHTAYDANGLPYSSAGSITTAGTAVAPGTCQAQTGITITGALTTSAVAWSIPAALPATWQTGIAVMPVVSANTVTLNLCNPTAASMTPAAQLVNVRVIQ
jgi:hypothetical protein